MPRSHTKTTGNTLPLLIAGVLVVFGLIAFFAWKGGDYSNLEKLPTEAFLKKPADFLGNRYAIRAQVDSQIKWEKGVGRILAVLPEGGQTRLPVFIPEHVGDNIHIGQRFEMRVLIEEGGLVYVEALRKY